MVVQGMVEQVQEVKLFGPEAAFMLRRNVVL